MAIFLNVLSGSRDLEGSAIDKAITAMAIRLAQARRLISDTDDANIELTLLLPSKNHKPDFQGMRMTSYSSEDSTLYMESAIPVQALHSEQADQYITAVLQDAVDNAADFFNEKGLAFSHAQWLGEVVLDKAGMGAHRQDVSIH